MNSYTPKGELSTRDNNLLIFATHLLNEAHRPVYTRSINHDRDNLLGYLPPNWEKAAFYAKAILELYEQHLKDWDEKHPEVVKVRVLR